LLQDLKQTIQAMLDPKYELKNVEIEIQNDSAIFKIQIKDQKEIRFSTQSNSNANDYKNKLEELLDTYLKKNSDSINLIEISNDQSDPTDYVINYPFEIASLKSLNDISTISINIANFNSFELELAIKKLQELESSTKKINLKLKNFDDHEKSFLRILADFSGISKTCPSPENCEASLTKKSIKLSPDLLSRFQTFYTNIPDFLANLYPSLASLDNNQIKLIDLFILKKIGIGSYQEMQNDFNQLLKNVRMNKEDANLFNKLRNQLIKTFDFTQNKEQRLSLGDNFVLMRLFDIFNESGYQNGDFRGIEAKELLLKLLPEIQEGFELMNKTKLELNKILINEGRSISITSDDVCSLSRLQKDTISQTGLAFNFSWLDQVIQSKSNIYLPRIDIDERLYLDFFQKNLIEINGTILSKLFSLEEQSDKDLQKQKISSLLQDGNFLAKLNQIFNLLKIRLENFEKEKNYYFLNNEIQSVLDQSITALKLMDSFVDRYPEIANQFSKANFKTPSITDRLKSSISNLEFLKNEKINSLSSINGHDCFCYKTLNGTEVEFIRYKNHSKKISKYDSWNQYLDKVDISYSTKIKNGNLTYKSFSPLVHIGTDNLGRRFLKFEVGSSELKKIDLPVFYQALNRFAKTEGCQYIVLGEDHEQRKSLNEIKSNTSIDEFYFDIPVISKNSILSERYSFEIFSKTPFADDFFKINLKLLFTQESFLHLENRDFYNNLSYLFNKNIEKLFDDIKKFKTDNEQINVIKDFLQDLRDHKLHSLLLFISIVDYTEKLIKITPDFKINEDLIYSLGMFYTNYFLFEENLYSRKNNELEIALPSRIANYRLAVQQRLIPDDTELSAKINHWERNELEIQRGDPNASSIFSRFTPEYPNFKSKKLRDEIIMGVLLSLSKAKKISMSSAQTKSETSKKSTTKGSKSSDIFVPTLTKEGFKIFIEFNRGQYRYHWNPNCGSVQSKKLKKLAIDEVMSSRIEFTNEHESTTREFGKIHPCPNCKPPKPVDFNKYKT